MCLKSEHLTPTLFQKTSNPRRETFVWQCNIIYVRIDCQTRYIVRDLIGKLEIFFGSYQKRCEINNDFWSTKECISRKRETRSLGKRFLFIFSFFFFFTRSSGSPRRKQKGTNWKRKRHLGGGESRARGWIIINTRQTDRGNARPCSPVRANSTADKHNPRRKYSLAFKYNNSRYTTTKNSPRLYTTIIIYCSLMYGAVCRFARSFFFFFIERKKNVSRDCEQKNTVNGVK